ncbi:PHD finger protein [Trichinella spiralis]|uniref:PHD finger protein n=1 Tax=Trichinella spiralis TaxID=6334 RepID=A0ABR3KUR3_TRISP
MSDTVIDELIGVMNSSKLAKSEIPRMLTDIMLKHIENGLQVDLPYQVCNICLELKSDGVFRTCSMCGLGVHQRCYGKERCRRWQTASGDKMWFCEPCLLRVNRKMLFCELCPTQGEGAFVLTTQMKWVHAVCALCNPLVHDKSETLSWPVSLNRVRSTFLDARCSLCSKISESVSGATIKCVVQLCKESFHASCASRFGIVEFGNYSDIHCLSHCSSEGKSTRIIHSALAGAVDRLYFARTADERTTLACNQASKVYKAYLKKKFKLQISDSSDAEVIQRPITSSAHATALMKYKSIALTDMTEQQWDDNYAASLINLDSFKQPVQMSMTSDFANYIAEMKLAEKSLKNRLIGISQSVDQAEAEIKKYVRPEELKLLKLCSLLTIANFENVIYPHELGDQGSSESVTECAACHETTSKYTPDLQCFSCERLYHMLCMKPPYPCYSKNDAACYWLCDNCRKRNNTKNILENKQIHENDLSNMLNSVQDTGGKCKRRRNPVNSGDEDAYHCSFGSTSSVEEEDSISEIENKKKRPKFNIPNQAVNQESTTSTVTKSVFGDGATANDGFAKLQRAGKNSSKKKRRE